MQVPRESGQAATGPQRWISQWWTAGLSCGWLIALLVLTLSPDEILSTAASAIPALCLICGTRGTADAILNVLLFMPFGLIMGGRRHGLPTAIGLGLALSMGIELAQTMIPGRHATLGDLLWNSCGAGVGVLLYSALRKRVEERQGVGALRYSLVLAASLLLGGLLMMPLPTQDDYWGQWMPDLGSMPQYDGTVLTAELNGLPFPSRRLDHARPHRELLTDDWELKGDIVVGSQTAAVSPILSIYDGHQREVLLLGAHGDALVFRERTIAALLRFDNPDVRVPGAFTGSVPSDTVSIGARRTAAGTCLWLATLERCGVGLSLGRTWGLLLYLDGRSERTRERLDLVWLALLFLPVGLFGRKNRDLLRGGAIGGVGFLASIILTPLLPGPWYEVLACVMGVALGRLGLLSLRAVAGAHEVRSVPHTSQDVR